MKETEKWWNAKMEEMAVRCKGIEGGDLSVEFKDDFSLDDVMPELLKEHRKMIVAELEGMRYDHVKAGRTSHSKDELYCCVDCYDDEQKNTALDEAIRRIGGLS